jgi:CBS domain-containing protein
MRIADICRHKSTPELISVGPGDSVERAAQIMTAKAVGALLVRNGHSHLAGIVSERDVIHAICHHGPHALQLKVGDIMTREVMTCRPNDLVRDVMRLMTARRIRHVPVTDGERIVDIVSIGDLLSWRLKEQDLEVAVLRDLSLAGHQ